MQRPQSSQQQDAKVAEVINDAQVMPINQSVYQTLVCSTTTKMQGTLADAAAAAGLGLICRLVQCHHTYNTNVQHCLMNLVQTAAHAQQ